MPVEPFVYGIEPDDPNTPIWRFLEFWKFQDLMKGHIYFHRADLFEDNDPQEGLPLDNYQNLPGRHPLDINDIQERSYHLGFDAQIRQGFYISCWYLAGDETAWMWHKYAKGNGVAICSTYARLKAVLEPLSPADKPHLGLVQYGNKHIPAGRRNLIAHIGTKSEKYRQENEVRAMLWIVNPNETGNRHIDLNNRYRDRPLYPTTNDIGIFRDIDVHSLITELIVSPFAEPTTQAEVEKTVQDGGYAFPVRLSDLTARVSLVPTANDLQKLGLL